jgi:alpha-D-glucose phosphate-specific phosphoglucomutase
MTEKSIQFGTDGWRGIIADQFTFENVKVVTQGVCEYLEHKAGGDSHQRKVVIGYDTRFLSDRFALMAAAVFAANKVDTFISDGPVPTPVLSHAVVNHGADLGIMITASHNPYPYNGYKVKGPYGGSATMEIIDKIETRVNRGIADGLFYRCIPPDSQHGDQHINKVDFISPYQDHIFSLIDTGEVGKYNFSLLLDPMYGAGQNIYRKMVASLVPGRVEEIHSEVNPAFGGLAPEPIGENLNQARQYLKAHQLDMAVCLDGDADRIGALAGDGSYVSSHHIFAVVLNHLAADRKLRGRVIKTVSTSSIIDRICRHYGLDLEVTPIGFKYIGEKILEGDVIMGGEESGGLWCYGNIPERDGMLMGLKLMEICALKQKTIGQILEDIYSQFGGFVYDRVDLEVTVGQKNKLGKLLASSIPPDIEKLGIAETITIDGYKYVTQDGSWLMIRPSGTEAVVRIYAESSQDEKLAGLLQAGKKVIDGILG